MFTSQSRKNLYTKWHLAQIRSRQFAEQLCNLYRFKTVQSKYGIRTKSFYKFKLIFRFIFAVGDNSCVFVRERIYHIADCAPTGTDHLSIFQVSLIWRWKKHSNQNCKYLMTNFVSFVICCIITNTFEVVIFVEVFEMSTNNHAQEPLRIVRPEQYYVYYLLWNNHGKPDDSGRKLGKQFK